MSEESFELFLRSALRQRPEHVPSLDISVAAMARARDTHMAMLARVERWTRFVSIAAAILIAITIVAGYLLWLASTTSAATTSYTTTNGATTLDLTTVGVVALIATAVSLAMLMIFTSDRPMMRLMPA